MTFEINNNANLLDSNENNVISTFCYYNQWQNIDFQSIVTPIVMP